MSNETQVGRSEILPAVPAPTYMLRHAAVIASCLVYYTSIPRKDLLDNVPSSRMLPTMITDHQMGETGIVQQPARSTHHQEWSDEGCRPHGCRGMDIVTIGRQVISESINVSGERGSSF